MHGNGGESEIFIEEGNLLELSLLVDVEHDFGFNLHEGVDIALEGEIGVVLGVFVLIMSYVIFVVEAVVGILIRVEVFVVFSELFVAVIELEVAVV